MSRFEQEALPVTFPFSSYAARNSYLDASIFGKLQPGFTDSVVSPTDEALERMKIIVANSVSKRRGYADIEVDKGFLAYQESLHPFTKPLGYRELLAQSYDKNYEVEKTLKNQEKMLTLSKPLIPLLLIAIIAHLALRGR